MKISIQSLLTIALIAISCALTQAQDCVSMYFDSTTDGDDLVVQLKVDNFDNILISQFAFTYSYLNLDLKSVQGNSDINLNESHVFSAVPGYISVSWSNATTGQTLADGSVLIELRFNVLIDSYSEFAIDPNFNIEFVNGFFEEECLVSTPIIINEDRSILVGKLYHDLNGNCMPDDNDLPLSGWTVLIKGDMLEFYRVTDAFGNYSIPVQTGNYTIEVLEKNDLWSSCEGQVTEMVTVDGEVFENSFALSPIMASSALEVSISSAEIRRCEDNVYSVKYKNNGTSIAQATEISVTIHELLDHVISIGASYTINGNVITYDVGNVKPGDGGEFEVWLNVDCDNTEEGQTLCVEANITSNDVVIPPVNWDGAVLTTEAECQGDSVAFTIQNIGTKAMTNALQSIVVEDDVMFGQNEVELEPNEMMTFKHAAFGNVYRVLIDQEDGYPLSSFSTDFVEFCNGMNGESYQYVAMFQNDDESPYRDIECLEIKNNEAANSMSAFPVGYREEHFINQNEDVEYTIYFRNTGTDTVRNMYMLDVLSRFYDINSLVLGPSSHDYTASIEDSRVLRFEFRNIQLPSSVTDSLRSSGFVKFRISQNKDVDLGQVIGNSAFIYFDSDDLIATNVVNHTIGESFIEIVLNDKEVLMDNELMIAPNPAVSEMKIEVPEQYKSLSYVLYDTKGNVVSAANVLSNVFYINRDFIEGGMYFLEIRSFSKPIGTKKIVFQD